MELASSSRRVASKMERGCKGLGWIFAIGMEATCGPVDSGSGTCWTAAVVLWGRRAERPLPNALRCLSGVVFTSQDLLCQLNIALRASRANIVGDDRLAVAGRLGQTDAARDHGFEDRFFEESSEIQLHLSG